MENYFLKDEEESMWGTGPEPAWCGRWEQNREKPSRASLDAGKQVDHQGAVP